MLNHIRALPWEYADTPADYVLGVTTCALFLSLKYHRLHPEYIYSRIKNLAGKYNLRIVLTMVDIDNHEEPLRELSKTSLINNVTVILCWTAQEAGRYLELYKSFENASASSIRAQQATTYSEQLTEFITTPRGINKTDALSLISSFGSVRTAINARPEEVALVDGFGEKKVQRWTSIVREPFRLQKAAKRGVAAADDQEDIVRNDSHEDESFDLVDSAREQDPALAARLGIANVSRTPQTQQLQDEGRTQRDSPDEDEEEALREASGFQPPPQVKPSANKGEQTNAGVFAALAKLRNND